MRKILSGIIIIFLLVPYLLDKFLMGKITTTMGMNEWFGFLGSYLGGGIAALITLYGIYWQMFETEKKEKKIRIEGFSKYVNYMLKKNLNLKFPYKIFNIKDSENKLDEKEFFINFSKNFLDSNIKLLFSLESGEEILELEEKIKYFNKKIQDYTSNYTEIGDRIAKIRQVINNSKDETEISQPEKEVISLLLDQIDMFMMLSSIQREEYLLLFLSDSQDECKKIKNELNILKNNGEQLLLEILRKLNILSNRRLTAELLFKYSSLFDIEINISNKSNYEKYLINNFETERIILEKLKSKFLLNEKNYRLYIDFIDAIKEYENNIINKIEILRKKQEIIDCISKILNEGFKKELLI